MKRMISRFAFAFLFIYLSATAVFARELIPVGQVIGLELSSGTVTVAAFDDALPAGRTAGLEIGDRIIAIDGNSIESAADVRLALCRSDGAVDLLIRRDGRELTIHMEPEITEAGPKLGVFLKQGITGLGTVTYYDPQTGAFGTLGHGVNDSKGRLLPMEQGNVYAASVAAVEKGRSGTPGQLRGTLDAARPLGILTGNTARGVFGNFSESWQGQSIPTAGADEIRTGCAVIRCTVDAHGPRDYSVEILKIYPADRADGRNLLLRVTDPALLEATGGIVQGMSGSPLIQDGKLIGAVTHVLVNDPTMGYGIFIENMLDAVS